MYSAHGAIGERSTQSDLGEQAQPRLLMDETGVRSPRACGGDGERRVAGDACGDPAAEQHGGREATEAAQNDREHEDTELLEQRMRRVRRNGINDLPMKSGEDRSVAGRPNGSRLSCGRSARRRKEVEPQIKTLAGEATQFLPTCERPAASSAC